MPAEKHATMTVDGFEHWGVITVRPRTNMASAYVIPALQEKELASAMTLMQEIDPEGFSAANDMGDQTRFNSLVVAVARYAIVDPTDVVDQILASSDPKDFGFFVQFAQEYGAWMDRQTEEAQAKKSGRAPKGSGKKSVSSSETDTDSPLLILDG